MTVQVLKTNVSAVQLLFEKFVFSTYNYLWGCVYDKVCFNYEVLTEIFNFIKTLVCYILHVQIEVQECGLAPTIITIPYSGGINLMDANNYYTISF